MKKTRHQWKRRPDRSFFVIALPFSFLLFLWGLLLVNPFPRNDSDLHPHRTPQNPVLEPVSGPVKVSPAVRGGLQWLARHQFEDGSWDGYYFQQRCRPLCGGLPRHERNGNPIGITALALLAFLEAGPDPEIDFTPVIRKAIRNLMSRQGADGLVGSRDYPKFTYGHAMALTAFARAYHLLGDPALPKHIRHGIAYLEKARTPGSAWGYGFGNGGNDTSITGWICLALAEANRALSPLEGRAPVVAIETFEGMHRWIERVTHHRIFSVDYSDRGSGSSLIPGVNDHFQQTEILTAIGMIIRMESGENLDSNSVILDGIDRLQNNLPTWTGLDGTCIDFCYWYFGLCALEKVSPNGNHPTLNTWQARLGAILTKHQNDGGHPCRKGSWDPVDKWGTEGGRAYATALNTLTLARLRATSGR